MNDYLGETHTRTHTIPCVCTMQTYKTIDTHALKIYKLLQTQTYVHTNADVNCDQMYGQTYARTYTFAHALMHACPLGCVHKHTHTDTQINIALTL